MNAAEFRALVGAHEKDLTEIEDSIAEIVLGKFSSATSDGELIGSQILRVSYFLQLVSEIVSAGCPPNQAVRVVRMLMRRKNGGTAEIVKEIMRRFEEHQKGKEQNDNRTEG